MYAFKATFQNLHSGNRYPYTLTYDGDIEATHCSVACSIRCSTCHQCVTNFEKVPEFTSTVPTLVSIQQVVLTTPSTMSKAFTIQSTVLPLVPMLTLTAMLTGHDIFGGSSVQNVKKKILSK